MNNPTLYASISLLVLGLLFASTRTSSHRPLPPGPWSTWFGNVELPKYQPWRTYALWKDMYGDLIYIRVFGNPILVLNSAQVISDLLEKRSGNYSSRPLRTMVVELIGWDWLFSSMTYGNTWKRHRNLFLKHFPVNDTAKFHLVQTEETHTLLRNLLESPQKFSHHVRRSAAAIILNVIYGIEIDESVDEQGDNFVTLADRALRSLSQAGIFGTYMVDYIPMLKHLPTWFPGASFRRHALKWRHFTQEMVNRPFELVLRKMKEGTASPCLVAEELEELLSGNKDEDRHILRNVAATSYAAGADTVVSASLSLFLAISLHPNVQSKAQAELDRVLGDRLPAFTDRQHLPYIDCICYELLRWNPVTPLGIAHYVSEEDEYCGYRIPKGTTVLPNTWAILHDPALYPDPLSFNPDRFENMEENAKKDINSIPDAAFGYGRRICPGRWFAFDLLWITVASTLSVYDINKATDDRGNTIQPAVEYTSGLLSHPKPFTCSIKPRSSTAKDLIMHTQPL
ncbi:cytochrome p450 [Moniliophthora roreri MCA 2997]|uniref:Cytochrome p450 n=1 Tax=Moniliophthora roreri (strain MCA 2997) TaxID=1381753 RepID=V2YC91_MONRO|nr:cytochrome p450 [Moniliophthora roreri MCA 2997]